MPRITLTLEPELLELIQQRKPKRQALSAFCADLLEQQTLGLDSASKLPAYRVGAGTNSLVEPPMQDLPTEQVKHGWPAQQGLLDSGFGVPLEPKKNKPRKGRNKGKTPAVYTPEFEAFWRAYQSLPVKAAKQSKPLALAAWNEALAHHPAEDLQRAVEALLQVQERELRTERGFTVAMPDCFRWLRDECYLALLEQHEPAQASKPSWML